MDRPVDPNTTTDFDASLEGVCQSIVYRADDRGFSVVRVEVEPGSSIVVVGPLSAVQPGERLRLRGKWQDHARFGRQFKASAAVPMPPDTTHGIQRYLSSGIVDGLGPTIAERIVERFGLDALKILDHEPERLSEVSGIGPKRRERIIDAWRRSRAQHEIAIFLQTHGIALGIARRIEKRYQGQAIDVVRRDPYRLAIEISGIGFRTADQIARSVGIAADDPKRIRAGVLHEVEASALSGHTYTVRGELIEKAAVLLEVEPDAVDREIDELARLDPIVIDAGASDESAPDARVHLGRLWEAEAAIAHRLAEFLAVPTKAADRAVPSPIELAELEAGLGLQLAPSQKESLERAASEKVVVITGGPGTGKTTLVRAIVKLSESRKQRIELAAPTGRAAKRMEEASGRSAKTIHRLLEHDPRERGFSRGVENPLDLDVLVLDEVSMVDVELFRAVVEALPRAARLVLVGDVEQLPSVGPGQVLDDLIRSRVVPTVRLDQVFRQGKGSAIVANAHRVLHGRLPTSSVDPDDGDFFVVAKREPDAAANMIVELVAERIPRQFGLDPMRDIQVLAPMRKGILGVDALNVRLQERLNPKGQGSPGGVVFRVGDRVIQQRNDYDLNIWNGDVGRVVAIDREEQKWIVEFDGREVELGTGDIGDLSLAYATTIHKSQGSEYPAVVTCVHTQHFVMLERKLFYTAITRGRQLVVVVGHPRAIEIAVQARRDDSRRTRLSAWLSGREDGVD